MNILILDSFNQIASMDMDNTLGLIMRFTKGFGNKIRKMAKGSIFYLMEIFILAILSTINVRGMARWHMSMAISTKGIGEMGLRMELAL